MLSHQEPGSAFMLLRKPSINDSDEIYLVEYLMRKLTVFVLAPFILILLQSFAFSQTVIKANQLQEDFAIFKKAYTELHPGLYRYVDSRTMEQNFDDLGKELQKDMPLDKAYLAFSRFLAKIKCGHTYCNFWNQSERVKQEVFGRADKVPFTFSLVDKRMIVVKNASDDERLKPGVEILSINGVSVKEILDNLIILVRGDGSNDEKRLYDLQLAAVGEYEAFDVYFPLVYPPSDGKFKIVAVDIRTQKRFESSLSAITRASRLEKLESRYGKQQTSIDDLWQFKILDNQTAYLKTGSFVIWKMKLDWKAFLRNAFQEIDRRGIKNLILDIRGNEGGADEAGEVLEDYIRWKPVRMEGNQKLLRYSKVSPAIDPYLNTWDKSFRNRENQVRDAGNGFYTWKNANLEDVERGASKKAFQGKIYLLVDAANSSATFYLASLMKQNQLATLVGQATGGNRRGLNGSQMFFLILPNSKIEMDIPLIGTYPVRQQPDEGIMPDIYVKPNLEDIINGVDTELEAVKRLISLEEKS